VSRCTLTTLTLRPLQGGIKAESAINTLNVFEGRLTRLTEDYTLVCRAKEALNLEHMKDDRLEPVNEEMRDLKAVWTALSGIWARLYQLRETLWSAVLVCVTCKQCMCADSTAQKDPTRIGCHSRIHSRDAQSNATVCGL
jgi:hypothetical protein